MSRARAKGTGFENHVSDTYLDKVWPLVHRAPQRGVKDYGDFENVHGMLIEAKKRDKWDLPAWIRGVLGKLKTPTSPWIIVFATDKRSIISMDLVVMPAKQYFDERAELQGWRDDV